MIGISDEDVNLIAETLVEEVRECKRKHPDRPGEFFKCFTSAFGLTTTDPIVDSLMKSINEEKQAVRDYTRRAAEARQSGDEETARLFEHIVPEEETHASEFRERVHLKRGEEVLARGRETLERGREVLERLESRK